MPSSDGQDGRPTFPSRFEAEGRSGDLETMLFESLVHQLIEKGLLTKNDALSIVQTVAQIKLGQLDKEDADRMVSSELALLRRLYESFAALRERSGTVNSSHNNVRQLRPPVHGDAPEFPQGS